MTPEITISKPTSATHWVSPDFMGSIGALLAIGQLTITIRRRSSIVKWRRTPWVLLPTVGIFTPTNFFNWFDIEVFGWLVAAIGTDNFEERYALYEMVMMRIARDVPMWYSGHTTAMLS